MGRYRFIRDEMLVHMPVCTHASPERVLVVGDDEGVAAELGKYSFFEDIKISSRTGLVKMSASQSENPGYDIIIFADEDLLADRDIVNAAVSLLSEKGILSSVMSDPVMCSSAAKNELGMLSGNFKIVMPYRYEREDLCSDALAVSYMVVASRSYHPAADINLQRADLTDGFRYYSSDIALASLQMPAFVVKEFTDIIKR